MAFYRHVKKRSCINCDKPGPSDAAHFRGITSPKTGAVMHRSHKGLPGWACVPLCRACHLRFDSGDQTAWVENGMGWQVFLREWGTLLAEFVAERVRVSEPKPKPEPPSRHEALRGEWAPVPSPKLQAELDYAMRGESFPQDEES